jgi:DNA-binding response OmpR family regulator
MKKIIIIEDDPTIGHIYKTRLEKEGYAIEVAVDGQSGFYRVHDFQPDAVLLDLMLPKMNGIEVLKKLRAEPKFARTPVIVFTNAYLPNMINESFAAGATLVFNKATLTPRQIIDSLQTLLFPSATPPGGGTPNAGQTRAGTQPESGEGTNAAALSALSGHTPDTAPAQTGDVAARAAEDSEFQKGLVKKFLEGLPEALATLRKATQEFSKASDESGRLAHLMELYRKVHALTGGAGLGGLRNISKMAAAVEVLLKELYLKPENVTASTMRTVAHSIDFLAELCTKGTEGDLIDENPIQILVVDDEVLSRRAIAYALDKTGLKTVSVEDSNAGLELATKTNFDLIFLDVQMPGMDGFDLCTKIRALPNHKKTPILFVTSLSDFKSRAQSSLSGGAELIAKPFMFIELTVKALTYVLRAQMLRAHEAKNAA